MNLEEEKQNRFEKFKKEHPDFSSRSAAYFRKIKLREKRKQEKIARIEKIIELRKKGLTLQIIGAEFGFSGEYTRQIIKKYHKSI